jgi:hypothetical protein
MRRARRAAFIVVLLGSASVLAAGKAGGESDVSPARTVKSGDGGLVVSIPRGALAKPTPIRIRTLPRSEFPPELRKATLKPGSKLYALEPAGLQFLKPVTITRRIDAKAQGFDLKKAVPGILLTTRSAGGKWEILRGQTVRVDGAKLVVTATTRHFSTIVAFDGRARLSLDPTKVDAVVGAPFAVKLIASLDNQRQADKLSVREVFWSAVPVVNTVGPLGVRDRTFTCLKPGTGSFGVTVRVYEQSLTAAVASFFSTLSISQQFRLSGRATCKASSPETAVLSFACVVVAHSSYGQYLSYTRWVLQFAKASLPPNARATLTATGVNGDQPFMGAIDATTGMVELKGGISSQGAKPVQELTVNGQDVTQQLVDKVGPAPTVKPAEGVISGTCPP